jgi:hypothetical protein
MKTGDNNFDSEEKSFKDLIIEIREWLIFLRTKKRIILITVLLGITLGFLYGLYEKPTYKAVLTFAMEEDKASNMGSLSGALGLASNLGIDLGGNGGGGAFAASNLTELMRSRYIVESVLLKPIIIKGVKTTLAEYFLEFSGIKTNFWGGKSNINDIHFLPNIKRNLFTLKQDSLLKEIHKKIIQNDNLIITQKDKKITILSIEVTSKNEIFSKIFCENLASTTSDFYIKSKSKKARINVEVLQKQVDSIKNELSSSINGVAIAVDNVYNLNPAYNIKGAFSKNKQVEVQANTVILTNLVVQLELAKITLRKETPLIQLIDEPNYPLEKEKFGKIKSIILAGIISAFLIIAYLIIGEFIKKTF